MYRIFIIILISKSCLTARILGVFPIPSISHQVVFRELTQELVKRGHEMVIITPNPAYPVDRPKDNVTEIDTGNAYNVLREVREYEARSGIYKRGVIQDVDDIQTNSQSLFQILAETYNNKDFTNLINDKNQKFDLLIIEAMTSGMLMLAEIYKAPVIWICSLNPIPEVFQQTGAVGRHPIVHPNILRKKYNDLSNIEMIQQIYYEIKVAEFIRKTTELEDDLFKKNFASNIANFEVLKKNVDLLLLNSQPYLDNNRAVPLGVVYLGALHLKPVKPLPEELKQYLDNSKRGVIYVSLGTNVRLSMMDRDFLNVFLNAFRVLPYDILWKLDDENVTIPSNVKVMKWFPQRDLLMHENIKAFVTQGGLQSTDEAIDATVPLVGIPIRDDQWYNVNKYVEQHIGIQLDGLTMTSYDLVNAVKTVIEDKSYKQNIIRLKNIVNDQRERPLERAVRWTEYILRHGGKHLEAPATNLSWFEFLMVDVIIVTLAAIAVIIILITSIVYIVIKYLGVIGKKKIK